METSAPVVMDSVSASGATWTISHSVPSITLPQTDKQRLEKTNESIGKTKKIFQRFHSTAGYRATRTPSEHAEGTVSSFILTKRNGCCESFLSLCEGTRYSKLAGKVHNYCETLSGRFLKLQDPIPGEWRAEEL